MSPKAFLAHAHRSVGTVLADLPRAETGGASGGPPGPPAEDGGDGFSAPRSTAAARTGILIALAAIVMFFMALTSAFVVRQGSSNDWVKTSLPGVLYLNTLALVGSSAMVEIARRRRKEGRDDAFRRLWSGATLLGAAFLVGQLVAWRQLAAQGIFLATSPGASFFYVLTASHGAHLVGGLIALLWVGRRSGRSLLSLEIAAIYWHFMGGLWIYLLLLLRLGG